MAPVSRIQTALLCTLLVTSWGLLAPNASAKLSKEMSTRAIQTLRSATQSGDFKTRAMAVQGLGNAPKKDVLATVKEALEDPQWQVRRATISALLRLKDKSWEKAIIDAMRSQSLGPKEEVLPLLSPLGTKAAASLAKKAMDAKDFPKPDRYARALKETGGPLMVAVFEQALRSKNPETVEAFKLELATLPLPDAIPLYKKVLAKQSAEIQTAVLDRFLAGESIKEADFVGKLVRSKNSSVALKAAAICGLRGKKDGLKLLKEKVVSGTRDEKLLAFRAIIPIVSDDMKDAATTILKNKDTDADLLRAAYGIHVALKNRKLQKFVEKRLMSTNLNQRAAAVGVLGHILGRASLATLHPLLKDGAFEIRMEAARAIGSIAKPESLVHVENAIFNESNPKVKTELVRAMAGIRIPAVVKTLQNLIYDDSDSVRLETVQALAAVRHQSTAATLQLALRDRSREVRRQALTALLRLGPEHHLKAFEESLGWVTPEDLHAMVSEHGSKMKAHIELALNSNRDTFRKAALSAIPSLSKKLQEKMYEKLARKGRRTELRVAGVLGLRSSSPKKAGEVLKTLVTDKDTLVKVAAIEALGGLKVKNADQMLMDLTNDLDERVRVAASAAMLQL
jgi:HEAT repeat protein